MKEEGGGSPALVVSQGLGQARAGGEASSVDRPTVLCDDTRIPKGVLVYGSSDNEDETAAESCGVAKPPARPMVLAENRALAGRLEDILGNRFIFTDVMTACLSV